MPIERTDRCERDGCGHAAGFHNDAGCRVTGCVCPRFMEAREDRPRSRRVAIDVPDGYTLSISLIPWDPEQPVIDATPNEEEAASGA
jgi:hypothetical protein